jgi:sugar phosphate isomerase/epimerase
MGVLMAALVVAVSTIHASEMEEAKANPLKRNKTGAKELHWELGAQLWTFGAYTLPEQLEIVKSLDLDFIEFGPNVKFSKEEKANLLTLSPDQEKRLKNLFQECGIPPKQLYVHIPSGEDQWRKWFEFAKDWKIDVLVAEPKPEHYDLLEELTKKYGVKVGVHNHPSEKNRYWHPDKVMEQIDGRNDTVGFNPDLGHWIRMGVDPVEQLQRPEVGKRLIGFHFNDVKELGVNKSPHVVPGTGAGRTGEMLELLKDLGYKGRFTIEHGNWGKSYGELCDTIRFFDEVALVLSKK